ncbi:MAG TPA: 4-carboxymuconolactone decarboxylase [Candidatus Sulfotelmatobacter sp.]|nr:4-carboxymuconolactone decarboxylase [Candidatus Sulfotelmatobacter sp.]
MSTSDKFERGLEVRREVLGTTHVDRSLQNATDFNRDYQTLVTEHAWADIWTRPGLDRPVRSLLVLAMTAALGRWEEFRLHLRATRNTGATKEQVKETLMQVAVYAGFPAANSAFHHAAEVYAEMDKENPS